MPFSERLTADIERFKDRVFTDPTGVLDAEDIHHEFAKGGHGRKLDFDKIDDGSDMFIEWMAVYARAVGELFPYRPPDVLVGVANGANRVARHVGFLLGIKSLETVKTDSRSVALDEEARAYIDSEGPRLALITEDVGTTGSTAMTAVADLRQLGVPQVGAINGWQRNPVLEVFNRERVPHYSVIHHPLPTFSPVDCQQQPDGYCYQGVELIRRQD